MSEDTTEVATEDTPEVATPVEASSKKSRRARKPSKKDWVRVIKSQGNTLENTTVHLIINEATGMVELVTNAPKKEGSDEMEGERTQVFSVTSYEVINDPDRDPLGLAEAAAAEAEKAARAEAKAAEKAAKAEAKAAEKAAKDAEAAEKESDVPDETLNPENAG